MPFSFVRHEYRKIIRVGYVEYLGWIIGHISVYLETLRNHVSPNIHISYILIRS